MNGRPRALLLFSMATALAQTQDPGHKLFETNCAACHGADANGGEFGPSILNRLAALNDEEIGALLRTGIPNGGMPSFNLSAGDSRALVAYLRVLRPPKLGDQALPAKTTVTTTDGKTLEGLAVSRGFEDMQLRGAEGRVTLLRKAGDRYRVVTSQKDWPRYDGEYSGNRYTPETQIDKSNVGRVAPRWIFPIPDTSPLEGTPIVVEGIMYVTTANQCYALDAGTGRQIWHFQRSRSQGLTGNATGGINRGAAVAGDRVFMDTDNAHLIALDRFNGKLLWETTLGDPKENYSGTGAPLAVGNLIISGIAGGDSGARGFVTAMDQATGKEVWRFWTAPRPGEPLSETWRGNALEHPGAVTWMSGTYDPALDLLYWPTGNPGPDMNGDNRLGDNLYSDCVLALEAKTGKLRWYYQFTPHDQWDWDGQQPPVLVDADWHGQPRKLLLQASRNGFFYVLDRTDGKLLLGKPFVQRLTWAKEIGADGRPALNPNQEPSAQGTRVCPSLIGAANWWSTSFNPATGLFYVTALESCGIFVKRPATWESGKGYNGGTTRQAPDDVPQKFLRAIDIQTGKIAWELPEPGPGTTRGGTLTTASGLVFFCSDSSEFAAADAANGKLLWRFPVNHFFRASPMTYVFDNKQYVAVESASNVIAFALPD